MTRSGRRIAGRRPLFLAAALAALCGPALAAPADSSPPATPANVAVYDPWEGMNRGLFSANDGLDRAVVRPVSIGYQRLLPKPVRHGVRNGLNNLGEPSTFVNDLLQGHPLQGGRTAARFVVNSTIGVAGLFDVAGGAMKLPIHYSDFGQTLGRYGVGPGPYVYLPLLGPSTVRDGTGRIVDSFFSILNLHQINPPIGARVGLVLVDGADTRASLDGQLKALRRTATDMYAAERSIYLQSRAADIRGEARSDQALPDFDATPAPAAPTAQPAPASTTP